MNTLSIKDVLRKAIRKLCYDLHVQSLKRKKEIVYCDLCLNGLTMCNTYFSASCGPDSCTRLAMSCKESVRKVCRYQKTDLSE